MSFNAYPPCFGYGASRPCVPVRRGLLGPTGATGLLGPTGATGLLGPTGPTGAETPWVRSVACYYSLDTQPISGDVNDPPTVFTYTDAFVEQGITLVDTTKLTVSKTAIYHTYYSIQISRTSGGSAENVYIWLRKNGADVPNSNGRITLVSNSGESLPIVPYLLRLDAGDYIEYASKRDPNHGLVALAVNPSPTGFGPAIPSIIVGLHEVSDVAPP
jgi:hypothetical protein